jgi:hypothetical protein
MKIAKVFSIWNGLEYMQIQQPELWQEIECIIQSVDLKKQKKEKTGAISAFRTELLACQWEESTNETAISSYSQTDFIKNRIAINIQFGDVAYDLFVKHLAFYIGDQIDVGIEILPMKTLQSQMSTGPSYYEGELYNIVRQGRGVPAVPLVVIGIEP